MTSSVEVGDDVDAVGDVAAVVAGDDLQAIEREVAGVDEELDAGARLRAAGEEASDDASVPRTARLIGSPPCRAASVLNVSCRRQAEDERRR